MKKRDIIKNILSYHPAMLNYTDYDEYKCGSPNDECAGWP